MVSQTSSTLFQAQLIYCLLNGLVEPRLASSPLPKILQNISDRDVPSLCLSALIPRRARASVLSSVRSSSFVRRDFVRAFRRDRSKLLIVEVAENVLKKIDQKIVLNQERKLKKKKTVPHQIRIQYCFSWCECIARVAQCGPGASGGEWMWILDRLYCDSVHMTAVWSELGQWFRNDTTSLEGRCVRVGGSVQKKNTTP